MLELGAELGLERRVLARALVGDAQLVERRGERLAEAVAAAAELPVAEIRRAATFAAASRPRRFRLAFGGAEGRKVVLAEEQRSGFAHLAHIERQVEPA